MAVSEINMGVSLMAEMRNLRTQRAEILTEITDLTGARAGLAEH